MVLINQLTAIADAIREQTRKNEKLTLPEMAQEIRELGGILVDETIDITTRTASGEITVYTSERLKNLTKYVVLFYEASPATTMRTIANLGLKTDEKTYDRIKIAVNTIISTTLFSPRNMDLGGTLLRAMKPAVTAIMMP